MDNFSFEVPKQSATLGTKWTLANFMSGAYMPGDIILSEISHFDQYRWNIELLMDESNKWLIKAYCAESFTGEMKPWTYPIKICVSHLNHVIGECFSKEVKIENDKISGTNQEQSSLYVYIEFDVQHQCCSKDNKIYQFECNTMMLRPVGSEIYLNRENGESRKQIQKDLVNWTVQVSADDKHFSVTYKIPISMVLKYEVYGMNQLSENWTHIKPKNVKSEWFPMQNVFRINIVPRYAYLHASVSVP